MTKAQLKRLLNENKNLSCQDGENRSEFQKQQSSVSKKREAVYENKAGIQDNNGSNYKYTAFVLFYVSDNRRRDGDGMLATVFDCLVRSQIIEDDCLKYIGNGVFGFERVEKGQEGFSVVLAEHSGVRNV